MVRYRKIIAYVFLTSVFSGCTDEINVFYPGSSIPVDTLPLLFTPFFQGEPSQPRDNNPKAELVEANVRGFGLGLSICRRIVAMHRGKIRAFNPVTGGAAFEIILPITQSDRIVYDRKERYQADAPYDGDR